MATLNRDKVAEEAREASDKVEERSRDVGEAVSRKARKLLRNTSARSQELREQTQQYVEDNPWRAIGITAAVAFMLGLLVGRRRG